MDLAIVKNQVSLMRWLLDRGLDLRDYLTCGRLEQLYFRTRVSGEQSLHDSRSNDLIFIRYLSLILVASYLYYSSIICVCERYLVASTVQNCTRFFYYSAAFKG